MTIHTFEETQVKVRDTIHLGKIFHVCHGWNYSSLCQNLFSNHDGPGHLYVIDGKIGDNAIIVRLWCYNIARLAFDIAAIDMNPQGLVSCKLNN